MICVEMGQFQGCAFGRNNVRRKRMLETMLERMLEEML